MSKELAVETSSKRTKPIKSAKRLAKSEDAAATTKKVKKVRTVAAKASGEEGVEETVGESATEVPGVAKASEKSRSESRKEQKELARERRLHRPFAEIVEQLRPLWGVIQQKNVSVEEKRKPIEEALTIARGHVRDLALKSDGSRMLQCIVAYCNEAQRVEISKELTEVSKLASDVRAGHLLKKLVKTCSASRAIVMAEIRGHVERFFKSRTTCAFLDDLYGQLNATNRMHLVAELYSVEFARIKMPEGIQTLPQLLQKFPAKREVVLDNLRKFVTAHLNKQILDLGIMQRILTDYLGLEVPARLAEKTEAYMDHLEALLQTPAGCTALVRIIAASAAKERKVIVKTLKGHVRQMVRDLNTAQVLMAIFRFTDDTVLVGKAMVQEIAALLGEHDLVENRVGQRVVLMLLGGVQDKYLTPAVASLLRECEPLAATTSKKDPHLRKRELLEYLLPSLTAYVDEHLVQMAGNHDTVPLLIEYLGGQPVDRCLSLVDRVVDEAGGVPGLVATPGTCNFLRLAIKSREEVARHIYGRLPATPLGDALKEEWAFVFLLFARWSVLRTLLDARQREIEEAARAKIETAERLLAVLQRASSNP